MNQKSLPDKLKEDAIVEAVFEMRFEMPVLPELLFGRLVDTPSWRKFEQRRLPAYDIPAVMRQADENLRYQAVFELSDGVEKRSIRLGPQVLSYHQYPPYPGWSRFEPSLHEAIEVLFAKSENLHIRRLGLRYLNAFRPELHGIRGIPDIDASIIVSGETISDTMNLNYTKKVATDVTARVMIATPDFVRGPLPPSTSLYVDVDVFTNEGYRATEVKTIKQWLTSAHQQEKVSFFGVLTETKIQELKK